MNKNVFDDLVVVKRSGQRVSFNGLKIALAIKKAFDSVQNVSNEKDINKVFESVLRNINTNYEGRKTINVEDVQDIIESELKNLKYNKIYESFKIYRENRAISRELCSEKEQHKFAKATSKLISSYDNSNIKSPIDILLNFGKTISLEYSKSYLIESKYVRAHDEGKIYINNLEFYSLGIFSNAHFDFSNAGIFDLKNIINLSKEIIGEVSIPNIDNVLIKYVINKYKKIFKTYLLNSFKIKGVYEYINIIKLNEEIDRINSIEKKDFSNYALNEEIKFIFENSYEYSINYLKEHLKTDLKEFMLQCENKELNLNNLFTFSFGINESIEGKIINEILCDLIKELKLKNIKFIYKVNEQSNNKIYELINLNKDVSFEFINKKHENVEYFNDGIRIYENIFNDKICSVGRMVIEKISINLPLLGLKNRNNIKSFYEELDDVLELTKNALISSFEFKASKYKENFKYLFKDNILIDSEKLDDDQKIRKILKQGVLNIELIGIKECIYALSKDDPSKKYLDLGLNIVSYIGKKCKKFCEEEKLNFTLSGTVNIKAYKSFLSIDKSIYGIVKNITDKENDENFDKIYSDLKLSIYEKFEYISKFQNLFNGGYVTKIVLTKNEVNKYIDIIRKYNINFVKFIIKGNSA